MFVQNCEQILLRSERGGSGGVGGVGGVDGDMSAPRQPARHACAIQWNRDARAFSKSRSAVVIDSFNDKLTCVQTHVIQSLMTLFAHVFRYAMLQFSEQVMAGLMRGYDPDGSGSVDFKKFAHNVMGTPDSSNSLSLDEAATSASVVRANLAKHPPASTSITGMSAKRAGAMIRETIENRLRSGCGLHDAFQLLDRDRSGSISHVEFRTALKQFLSLDFSDSVMAKVFAAFGPGIPHLVNEVWNDIV